jgi:2-dehydropantoate 2-reductase
MRAAIVGLGGVGGYYGGKLALQYAGSREHQVIFIARGAHLKAIQENGLRLMTVAGEFTVIPALATDSPGDAGPFDLVLVCVKSYGLEEAARRIKDNIHDRTVIIPLLNGVNMAERLRAVLPAGIILGGCVYISTRIEGPGAVRQVGGSCQLIFGPEQGADTAPFLPVLTFLKNAGILAELVPDIRIPLWNKYIFIDPMAGLTAMLGKAFGEILEDDERKRTLEALMREVAEVAKARGVSLPEDIVPATIAKAALFPKGTKTSFQLDFEKGNAVELDIFTGYMVAAGKKLGIPVPMHEQVHAALLKKDR